MNTADAEQLALAISIIGSLGGLGGLVGATYVYFRLRAQNRSDDAHSELYKADAAATIKTAALELLKPLQDRIEKLERELEGLKIENQLLRKWAYSMRNRLNAANMPIPAYPIDDRGET